MRNPFFILILSFVFVSSYAQDLIIKKDQNKVFCEIISIDSLYITYKKPPSKNNFIVSRADVSSYILARPLNDRTSQSAPSVIGPREIVYISFRAGIANPIGEYGSADLMSDEAGLALSGLLLEGSLLFKASDYFGLLVKYHDQRNPFSYETIITAIDPSGRANITSSADDWRTKGVFAGVNIMLPFKNINRLSFNTELVGGFPMHQYPNLTITYPTLGGAWEKGSAPPVRAFSFAVGIGMYFKANKNVSLFGGFDYLQAKPKFAQTFSNSLGYISYSTHEQKITTINFKLGVSYVFLQKTQLPKP